MVRLTGALSNRQALPRLAVAVRRHASILASGELSRVPQQPLLRLPMGAIGAAVAQTLDQTAGSLRLAEIHALVEQRLERAISRDTVASFLSVAAREASTPIVRTAPGQYAWGGIIGGGQASSAPVCAAVAPSVKSVARAAARPGG
jgi:hypothetical protein